MRLRFLAGVAVITADAVASHRLSWPADRPVPPTSIEFDVADILGISFAPSMHS